MNNADLWRQQLADGKLSQEDFDYLMKSQESLDEMDKLEKKEEDK